MKENIKLIDIITLKKSNQVGMGPEELEKNAKNNVEKDVEKGVTEKAGEDLIKNGTHENLDKIDELYETKNSNEIVDKKRNRMKKKFKFSGNGNVILTVYTIIGYFFTSIAIIYYNHWLFDKVAPFPVFATWVQQIVGVCCFGLVTLSRKTPDVSKISGSGKKNKSSDLSPSIKGGNPLQVNSTSTNCTTNENIPSKDQVAVGDSAILEIEDSSKKGSSEKIEGNVEISKDNIEINHTKGKDSSVILFGIKKIVKILPMSICFVGLVAFGNICLKYVQVSTYQLARSGSLIFTVIVSYLMLGQKQTWQSILACVIVCVGFLIGSLDRSSLSAMGIITGLASSFCQVFYNVFMKKCMNYFNGDAIELMKYNQCISTILLIPCIFLAKETDLVFNSPIFDINQAEFFRLWVLLFICGLISMLLNYFTFLVVGYTSPVTFNVLGMFKSCAQTAGGFIIFHDHATPNSITGICLTLTGSIWYGFAKSVNCKPKDREAAIFAVDSENKILIYKDGLNDKEFDEEEMTEMKELEYRVSVYDENIEDIVGESISVTNENSCSNTASNTEFEIVNGYQSDNTNAAFKIDSNSNLYSYSDPTINTNNSNEKLAEPSLSLSSCISEEKIEFIDRKVAENTELTKLFEKFDKIPRRETVEAKKNISKISVSLPASVCNSPITESRQISVDIISNDGNKVETPNESNISLDVSISIDSERGAAENSILDKYN
ncbi:hypothetical protein FG379_000643 [Cryptosporidium bovis]|uniref:uncharacterized protein n=1 Tax=Cryptosporidium bovis TaxID=310047 RepID=UPI00351A3070|nr:hypothetical protein FG379_000643 [Cryptosporidium bovis]